MLDPFGFFNIFIKTHLIIHLLKLTVLPWTIVIVDRLALSTTIET